MGAKVVLIAIFVLMGLATFSWQVLIFRCMYANAIAQENPAVDPELERIAEGLCKGPEDVAIDSKGYIYGGMEDGTIMRFQPDGSSPEVFANTEGRPLGLDFDANGNLVVCDANKGLLSVAPDGEITVLTTEHGGIPFKLTDDVEVAGDGMIYFSDATSKYSIDNYMQDSGQANGRLLAYDPATKETHLLMDSLYFANGIAVSPDQSFVLVNETWASQVRRYWTRGPRKGQSDIFIDDLPGYPGGVSSNGKGTFWLAIADGSVLGLDMNGEIIITPLNYYPSLTSVQQHSNMLYLGSLTGDAIGRLMLSEEDIVITSSYDPTSVMPENRQLLTWGRVKQNCLPLSSHTNDGKPAGKER